MSPLENKENESLRLVGSRRIGSGRIMAARTFERDLRPERELRPDKERERDYKDKRFRVRVQWGGCLHHRGSGMGDPHQSSFWKTCFSH